MSIARHLKQASLALLMLSPAAALQSAYAEGTTAGTSISNTASVNYSVGGVAQTPINSTTATFVVDRRIFLSVVAVSPSPTELAATVPGAPAVVRTFRITNTSNRPIGFRFVPTNAAADAFDLANLIVRVDSAAGQPIASFTPGTYDSSTDTATTVATLAADQSTTVFVLGDIPVSATNTQSATINLQAVSIEPTSLNVGAVGSDIVQTAGADTAGIDTVFGDAGRDGTETTTNVYTVSSATLGVTKAATVISDPFNNTTNPKAIPGAVVEYAITIANTGAVPAQDVGVSDALDASTTIATGAYSGSDIQIAVSGGSTTTCTAAADGDGCSVSGGTLTIAGSSRPNIPAGQTATVRFRVTIN
ncbi:MAG TPA: hypothetical protein PKE27_08220 [Povalibacter sp.]|uniref:hypothetical protein n=1 Tax=Povalibacter sp. TaxID=1962978 RepID=UPI002D144838|nr:hypothetical protein [Povalibacter sp.]HMN44542.1 hypothetical protein [Povalibacter sp.]